MGKIIDQNGRSFYQDSAPVGSASPASFRGNGEALYDDNRLIRRCVDIISEDAVRSGWSIQVRDSEGEKLDEQTDYINQRMGELNTQSEIYQIFKTSLYGTYGGAGVMLADGVVILAERGGKIAGFVGDAFGGAINAAEAFENKPKNEQQNDALRGGDRNEQIQRRRAIDAHSPHHRHD